MSKRSRELAKRGEKWKPENRERNVYPPPNDGREWMRVDEAAQLFRITTSTLLYRARRLEWRRVTGPGVKSWLLKEDVMKWWDFLQMREKWYKKRRPKNWEPEVGNIAGMEEERIKRVFWTSRQAAEYLGVSVHRVQGLGRSGKLPVYVTNSVEEYRATEHYQKTTKQGKQAVLAVIGRGEFVEKTPGVLLTRPFPPELSFGYTREELRLGYTKEELSFGYSRDNMPESSLTVKW